MTESYLFTQEEFDALKEKLRVMTLEDRPEIKKAIAAARAQGDLSENAEYHASRERLGMLEMNIQKLELQLSNSEVYDPSERPKGMIYVGAQVVLENMDTGAELEGQVVSAPLFNSDVVEISTKSPVGKAILGKKKGDEVVVESDRGTKRWKVKGVN